MNVRGTCLLVVSCKILLNTFFSEYKHSLYASTQVFFKKARYDNKVIKRKDGEKNQTSSPLLVLLELINFAIL